MQINKGTIFVWPIRINKRHYLHSPCELTNGTIYMAHANYTIYMAHAN